MTCRTTKEAASMLCPIARISARPSKNPDEVPRHCCAEACMFWRWRPMWALDKRFTSAVAREVAALQAEGHKAAPNLLHGEAVKRVAADPQAYTFPDLAIDKGYCGMAGKPQE